MEVLRDGTKFPKQGIAFLMQDGARAHTAKLSLEKINCLFYPYLLINTYSFLFTCTVSIPLIFSAFLFIHTATELPRTRALLIRGEYYHAVLYVDRKLEFEAIKDPTSVTSNLQLRRTDCVVGLPSRLPTTVQRSAVLNNYSGVWLDACAEKQTRIVPTTLYYTDVIDPIK
ncbi:hypothetical protein C0J52_23845 [Blattella germanica]|nr:hypothetical protein C0J52_23845 [Blattella germanica]